MNRLRMRGGASVRTPPPNPEILLQASILSIGDKTTEGVLIQALALPWLAIVEELQRDPAFLFHFAQNPRKFEEFIAATYARSGFDEVTLTPQRGDKGRDVIATKHGFGSIRFLEQAKAYSPGHLVTHDDVRAMLGTLMTDAGASKGLITTTSGFQPGILKQDNEFSKLVPHRLELKDGAGLMAWLEEVKAAPFKE